MNLEPEIFPAASATHSATLGIHPGIGGWSRQFTALVRALSEFISVAPLSEENWAHMGSGVSRGTLCCGLRGVTQTMGSALSHPLIVFVDESEAAPDFEAGYSVEQRLEACAKADVFVVSSVRMRAYVAGWVVQAGQVPENRDFIVHFDAEHPASAVQKILDVLGPAAPNQHEVRSQNGVGQPSKGKPYFGSVSGKPAFLSVRADSSIELQPGEVLSQQCVIPAENVAGLEVKPGAGIEGEGKANWRANQLAKLELSIRVVSAPGSSEAASRTGALSGRVIFPALRIPAGGTEVLLEVVYRKLTGVEPIRLAATTSVNYPLIRGATIRNLVTGESKQLPQALAIAFIPADSTVLYRIQVLARRGIGMVRRGELGRVGRALLRRLPEVAGMVGNRLQQQWRKIKK